MDKNKLLLRVAKIASEDFEKSTTLFRFVEPHPITRERIRRTSTNGISIECGVLSCGAKKFTFAIWLDQLLKVCGDPKTATYFWYGVAPSSAGALSDLIPMLPELVRPAPIFHLDGVARITARHLGKAKSKNKKFVQFAKPVKESELFFGKTVEERYVRKKKYYIGVFAKNKATSLESSSQLATQVKEFWASIADAAHKPSRMGAPSASKKFIVELKRRDYEVLPSHQKLQKAFVNWLESSQHGKFVIKEDVSRVDVLLEAKQDESITLVEVKPGGKSEIRRAVREAIGQLFEYRHDFQRKSGRKKRVPQLALVLQSKPPLETASLLRSLDIKVIWKEGKKFACGKNL